MRRRWSGLGLICPTGKIFIDPTHASATFFRYSADRQQRVAPAGDALQRAPGRSLSVLVNFWKRAGGFRPGGGDATNCRVFPTADGDGGGSRTGYQTQVWLSTTPMTIGQASHGVGVGDHRRRRDVPPNALDGKVQQPRSSTYSGSAGNGIGRSVAAAAAGHRGGVARATAPWW
ncbi:MAG: hypothetical protein H6816_14210 [Phycisphaerales bacterium]|nr:hypothetical protein [Phycisphaerales bacterium]